MPTCCICNCIGYVYSCERVDTETEREEWMEGPEEVRMEGKEREREPRFY